MNGAGAMGVGRISNLKDRGNDMSTKLLKYDYGHFLGKLGVCCTAAAASRKISWMLC